MQRPSGELQERIKACENPTFGYRRGEDGEIEKDIFDGYVPAGWVDSPAKVDEIVEEPMEREVEKVPGHINEEGHIERGAPPANDLAPPYEDHSFNALRAEVVRRGQKWQRTEGKKALIARLYFDDDSKIVAG